MEKCGNTGNSTGTHLHLELSTTKDWVCGNFLNPVEPLGIPNEKGTIVEYGGDIPPQPEPEIKKSNSKKWLFFKSKKIRIFT